jgi:hypothetical protein
MKKYLLTIALFAISYLGFSQTTPTAQLRIVDGKTLFGQNLPAGTQIYDVLNRTLWQAKIGIPSTLSIETALAALAATTPIDYLVKINSNVSYFVQSFEAAASPGTYTLTYLPLLPTTSITVMMNGAALRPTTDYTSADKVLTILSGQSEYDKFVVSYTYTNN